MVRQGCVFMTPAGGTSARVEAEAEGITTDLIITQILKDVPKNAETVGA